MKKWQGITFLLFLLLFNFSFVLGQTNDECLGKQGQERIDCLEQALKKFSAQSKTLAEEINKRKTQIKLTNTKIAETESQIALLSSKIARLEVSLDFLAGVLGKRIIATYKKGEIDPLSLFFSSRKFSEFITRYKYLKVIQLHDKKLLFSMEETRTNYDEQKKMVEVLKKKLEEQRTILSKQEKELEFLLAETKNQEKIYQDLLARALAEQAAVQRAIGQAIEELRAGKGEPISTGQTIALLGNSGAPDCSTGPHLHFTVLKDGVIQNPAQYLKNIPLVWDNPDPPLTFTGTWDWPISNPRITQSYGDTFFARSGFYGGNPHSGIDMTSEDLTIRAPKEGRIIRGTTTCDSPRVSGVSVLKFAAIGHSEGLITVYLHIQ